MTMRRYLFSIALWILASTPVAFAQSDGGIIIEQASIELGDTNVRLKADAEIVLPREIREGLNSGVPLEFIVELRLQRPRRWLPAAKLASFQRRYSLIYYELTRHYRVLALDTDVSRNFRSLLPALDALGEMRDVMIPISTELASLIGDTDQASLVIKLNTGALPLPLQPVFSSTWRLASEKYLWPIN